MTAEYTPTYRGGNSTRAPARSVFGEVIVQLPGGDLRDVLFPFLPLRRKEMCRDVLSERRAHHVILLQFSTRLFEIMREVIDSESPFLPVRHLPDVLVD